jgi:aminopeptidase Y
VGDVTARLRGVDLAIPTFGINSTDSGCEAGDFAGFPAGTVALLQRGTCDFADKVFNAFAAGAVGVINEGGDPSRIDRFLGTLGPAVSPVPVLTTTFPVGLDLFMMQSSQKSDPTCRVAIRGTQSVAASPHLRFTMCWVRGLMFSQDGRTGTLSECSVE